ncbi:MAG TPA: hypothetical protein VFQ88_04715 [Nevskiaceae bacterium]|nr:hypothetical protein [Nevskiaceae bacterium]
MALGFFLGQFCAVLHASHHELVHLPDQPACMICAIAHAAGLRPALPPLPPAAPVLASAPVVRRLWTPRVKLVNLPPSRAPPPILA